MAASATAMLNVKVVGSDSGASRAIGQVRSDLDRAKKSADSFSSRLEEAGGALTALGVSAAATGAIVYFQFKKMLGVATEFQSAMLKVKAIAGATDAEFSKLTERARDLGASTEYTQAQVADGMRYLTMAGLNVDQTVRAIAPALDLATAGFIDLGEAADIATNIMTPFGISADDLDRVTDALAVTVANSNTNIQEMGYAMSFAAPVAAALGVSVEETAAMIGALAGNGIKATNAGTGLRAIMAELSSVTPKAAKKLNEMGVEIAYLDGGSVDVVSTLQRLKDAGLTASDAFEIFNRRTASVALALSRSIPKYDELVQKIGQGEGAARRMADTIRGGWGGAIKRLESAFAGLYEAAIEPLLPALTAFVERVASVVSAVALWAKENPRLSGTLTALTGVVGLVVTALGLLVLAVGGLALALAPMRQGWAFLATTISGPVTASLGGARTAISTVSTALSFQRAKLIEGNDAINRTITAWNQYARVQAPIHRVNMAVEAHNAAIQRARATVAGFASRWGPTMIGTAGAMAASFLDIGDAADQSVVAMAAMAATFGPIPAAIAGIAAALYTIIKYWKELNYWLKEDLGVIYDIVAWTLKWLTPLGLVKSGIEAIAGSYGEADVEVKKLTDSQRAWVEEQVEQLDGVSEATQKFVERWKQVWGEDVPREATQAFFQIRVAAQESAKAIEQEFSNLGEGAAFEEFGEFWQTQIREAVDGVATSLETFKERTSEAMGAASDAIEEFNRADFSGSREALDSVAKEFGEFRKSVMAAMDNVTKSASSSMVRMLDELNYALENGADKEIIDAMVRRITELRDRSVEVLTSLRDQAEAALTGLEQTLRSVSAQIKNTAEELKSITQKKGEVAAQSEKSKQAIADRREAALRRVNRRDLTDEQKEAESLQHIINKLDEIQRLRQAGDLDSLKRAQEISDAIFREAQGLSDAKNARMAINRISEEAEKTEEALEAKRLEKLNEEKTKLEEKKKQLEEQQAILEKQISSTETLVGKLSQQIKMAVDSSAIDEKLVSLKDTMDEMSTMLIDADTAPAEAAIAALRENAQQGVTVPVTAASNAGVKASEAPGYASGGRISGYGGGDTVPALLERGEFVMRKEAVKAYGSRLFAAYNALAAPRTERKAKGGLIRRFQAGGEVSGGLDFAGISAGIADAIRSGIASVVGSLDSLMARAESLQSRREIEVERFASAITDIMSAASTFQDATSNPVEVIVKVDQDGSISVSGAGNYGSGI